MSITKRSFPALLILGALLLLGAFFMKRHDSLLHGLQHYPHSTAPIFKKLDGRPALSQNEYLNIGWLKMMGGRNDSPSFLERPLRKAAGVVRVGLFGGSRAVCGGGAGKEKFTYPDFLKEKFKKAGIDTVEIINFGVGGYGMAQEYMLWKFLGQAYDLDYAIFAIHDLSEIRDLSFKTPYRPMHARFILAHDQLVFVPVIGLTRDEACEIYYRLPPPWRYLRYDKTMPLWLKAFLPESLHDRVNPFYYKSRAQGRGEWLSISAALLKEISPQTKQVIVLVKEENVGNFRSAVKCPNVHFFAPKANQSLISFPYLSDWAHPNALGNELIAEELFSYLTGKESWSSSLLKVAPCLRSLKGSASPFTLPLSEYDALSFRAGQRLVAGLFRYQAREPLDGPPAKFFADKGKIESFVMLSSRDSRSFGFLPLTFALKDQETVFISFKIKGHARKIPCGTVHAPSGIVGEIEGASKAFALNLLDRELIIRDPEIIGEINKGAESINIMIVDKAILRAQPAKVNVLDSFKGKFFHQQANLRLSLKEVTFEMVDLKSDYRYFFEGDPFEKETGTLDLVLRKKGGGEERCPLFSYQRVPFKQTIPDTYKDLKV
jgi:hypothetical protein